MIAKNKTRSKAGQKELCPLGQRLDALAKKRGWTKDQLAEAAGITYIALWSISVGRRKPTRQTAENLCAALGVTMHDLFDNYVEPKAGRPRKTELCQFGKKIESMAARRGMNRSKLASEAGVTYGTLWKILVGQVSPSLGTALRLSRALNVTVSKLVG